MVWKKNTGWSQIKYFKVAEKYMKGILKKNFMIILYKSFSSISLTKFSAKCLFLFSFYAFSFTGMKRTAMICSKRGMKEQQAAHTDHSQTQIE